MEEKYKCHIYMMIVNKLIVTQLTNLLENDPSEK